MSALLSPSLVPGRASHCLTPGLLSPGPLSPLSPSPMTPGSPVILLGPYTRSVSGSGHGPSGEVMQVSDPYMCSAVQAPVLIS